ncbi:alpha/beta fold hydrolase [Nocardia jiangsuensis]|uniref:Alpha/beta fold hydrolase n=1 Tax=Nocardia jiangsuensis TaxID=1691563 RepID=A0ABV8E2R9_9NOCA
MLLLHAGGERRQVWRPVTAVLTDAGFRCVAFDQRGHGESGGTARTLAECADDVAALIATEPGCVVVGASLGGLAAIAALADPAVRKHVSGLVLVDVVPNLEPDRIRRFLASRLGPHAELVEDILAHLPVLGKIDTPILLVRGGDGSVLTDADVEGLRRAGPQVTVLRVPTAGHLIARDQPVRLAEAIEPAVDWPASHLLRELGADAIAHPGGTVLDHLRRVHTLVSEWGASPRLRLAALCHAAYGTDGRPHRLLPPHRRDRLRRAIGTDAENLVYRYCSCERRSTYARLGARPLPLTDRFTGEVIELDGSDLADFAILTIANEWDVARHAARTEEVPGGIHELIEAFAVYAPEAAARVLA